MMNEINQPNPEQPGAHTELPELIEPEKFVSNKRQRGRKKIRTLNNTRYESFRIQVHIMNAFRAHLYEEARIAGRGSYNGVLMQGIQKLILAHLEEEKKKTENNNIAPAITISTPPTI